MTDSVLIEQLAVEAIIGVFDWEREVHQRLLLDLELAWDNSCLLYTSPSPRDRQKSRMPSSA